MKAALDLFKNSSIYNRIKKAINDGKSLDLSGVTPTFKPFLLSGLSLSGSRGLLWITSSWDNCEKLFENTYPFFPEGINNRLGVFPALGKAGNQELTPALRMKILEMLNDKRPVYIIAPFKALLQECETPGALKEDSLLFKTGENQPMEAVQNQLESMGYSRNYQVEKRGEYSRRGGILDVYPSTYNPVRIEFFGDEVDSIRHFDLDSQISTEKIRQIRIYPLHETRAKSKLLDIIGKDYTLVVDDPSVIKFHATEWDMEEGRDLWNDFLYEMKDKPTINVASWDSPLEGAIDLNTRPLDSMGGNIEKLLENTHKWQENNEAIVISTQHHKRLKKLMLEKNIPDVSTNPQKTAEPGQIILLPGDFTTGFLWQDVNLRFVTDKEILGRTPRKKRVLRAWDKTKAIDLEELKPGELVVHLSHGLGKFVRLAHLVIQGVTRDFVELEYKNNDKLFVPVQQLDLLQKYIGLENRAATLNRLGGSDWKRTRSRAKKAADEMADELIKLYSERERAVGYKFSPDTSWQLELEASFPFDETEDQTKAIDEVKKAMESTRPMDFLLCGDAGYGKTEVALRAAFKAVQDGKQVAMISPTTILTSQHFETFSDRLKTFPAHVGLLSRFRSRKEQRDTINRLATREVDIVIGTHRLLQKDIMFSDLGLVIVDEEQHFGVKHKEKLKKLKVNVDVLTMTATPIPRTLHMAMSGLRDLVVIETPPEDRLPIKTYLHEYDSELIRSLIVREMERGGQVYFVHNRVHNIAKIAQDIRRVVPFAKVAVGHGQMDETELESVMMDFYEGVFDVLVCTTIIESGLDLPNANTIIINNAQNFGLSQLYQLRGRVGRSNHQAYAYLLYPPHIALKEDAQKRLEAIRDFSHLGAGFQIAMKDLEIRGAGNLLGPQQSGYIAAVGFELYCQILKEAIEEKRGIERERKIEAPLIELPVDTFIPGNYIPNSKIKLEMYRKIARIDHLENLPKIKEEFTDRFGKIPLPLQNLFRVLKLKLLAWDLGAPYVKEVDGKCQILLPGVRDISLKQIQKIYEKTSLKSYFYKSILTLEDIFKKKTKSLVPDSDRIPPHKWLPNLVKLLQLLLNWKQKEKIQ